MPDTAGAEIIPILYVDDEPALLEVTKLFLERTGDFSVDILADPRQAPLQAASGRYEAVVSDYQMPKMDGITLLKTIRQSGCTVPFIIFTGKGREEVVIEALNSGTDFYLQKGGDPKAQFAELAHKLRQAVKARRAETELAAQTDLLENLIGYANAPIIVWNPELVITRFNRAAEDLTGIPVGEAVGSPLAALFPDERHETALARFRMTLTGERLEAVEIPIRHRSGSIRTILWSTSNILDRDGSRIIATIAQGQDITDRKLAEEALRESEERYRTMFENTGTAIVTVEDDTTISLVNAEFVRLSGYSREEIEGKKQWTEFIDPANLEQMLEQHRLRRSAPAKAVQQYEFRFVSRDGAVHDILMTIGILPGTGRSIASLLDITGRKDAEMMLTRQHEELASAYEELTAIEEELRTSFDDLAATGEHLRESERRLADIIEFLPDATFVIDADGKVIAWNRAIQEMTGIGSAEVVGKGDYEYARLFYGERRPVLIDLVLEGDEAPLREHYSRISHSRQSAVIETENARLKGKNVVLWATATPLYDGTGAIVGAIESIRDITEQRAGERALLRANEELLAANEHLAAVEEELRQQVDEIAEAHRRIRESEERYRDVVESQTELICRFTPGGVFLFVNEAFLRYFGLSRETLIGRRFYPAVPDEDRQGISDFFASLTKAHPAGMNEHRVIQEDGVVRWLRWSGRAIFDLSGRLIEYQSVGHDVTEQKEIEERLRESEAKSRTLVEHALEGTLVLDRTGTILLANRAAAATAGYGEKDLPIGRSVLEFIAPESREAAARKLGRARPRERGLRW